MLRCRSACFRFANPVCPCCAQKLTPHERQFMACLRHLRRGKPEHALRHAVLLCEANDPSAFLTSLDRFAASAA